MVIFLALVVSGCCCFRRCNQRRRLKRHSELALTDAKAKQSGNEIVPSQSATQPISDLETGETKKKKGMDWQQLAADQNRLKELEQSIPTNNNTTSASNRSGGDQRTRSNHINGSSPSSAPVTTAKLKIATGPSSISLNPTMSIGQKTPTGPETPRRSFNNNQHPSTSMPRPAAAGTVIQEARFVPNHVRAAAAGTVITEAAYFHPGTGSNAGTYLGEAAYIPSASPGANAGTYVDEAVLIPPSALAVNSAGTYVDEAVLVPAEQHDMNKQRSKTAALQELLQQMGDNNQTY